MSVKLNCCLCCTICINEYQYLENDYGECNEIYEITVKYFDPMLLTENINTVCSKRNNALCKNCWEHIQNFHNFQETVIQTRTSLEQINIENTTIQTKGERLAIFNDYNNINSVESDELKKTLKNDLVNKNSFEEDCKVVTSSNEEIDDNKPLIKLRNGHKSRTEIGVQIQKENTIILLKEKKTGGGREANFKVFSEEDDGEDKMGRKKKHIKNSSKNEGNHPALEKGREYDKFISEWKSELECDICSEVFPIFDLLKIHFKNQHNTRGFVKCCDRKFDRRCSLVEHIRLHINPEMHKCDICGKISGNKYSLIHHKKTIHGESQKYKCSECPKFFKQKQNLKCHLLTHVAGNRDFKCKECGKAYVLELQLKKHIKLVHIDNRICDQCGKTLHGIGALKNHLKEHDDIDKPKYPCDECGAELGSRITLKRHKASYHNDGSTVYICSLCGKVSSTERALKNHKKYVHEIERKYKCVHCDKAFKRSQNLQEHIATHTGEALYQCQQCPRSFKINSKYHEHRKKAHPIEWEAGRKNRLEKQKIDYERVTNQIVL